MNRREIEVLEEQIQNRLSGWIAGETDGKGPLVRITPSGAGRHKVKENSIRDEENGVWTFRVWIGDVGLLVTLSDHNLGEHNNVIMYASPIADRVAACWVQEKFGQMDPKDLNGVLDDFD